MLSQYEQNAEFAFEIVNKKIKTIQTPIVGKRISLFDILKSNENIYGVQDDLTTLQAELEISTLNNLNYFDLIQNTQDIDRQLKILNLIYLQNNIYSLILLLYHNSAHIRKAAFTLLLNGFEINPLMISFFQTAFKMQDPYSILIFPDKNKSNFKNYLNRECVRWLTSLYQQTKQDKIWQRYSEQDIQLSIETQKNSTKIFEDSFSTEVKSKPEKNVLIDTIVIWMRQVSNSQNTIIPDSLEIKQDKVYSLRYKWLQANSRIKSAQKFLERLLQKWDDKKESEFSKAFLMFLSGLSLSDRQIFFIYGAAIEDENIMSLCFRYITEVSPITSEHVFSDKKIAQQYVKAIIQAKFYGAANNSLPLFKIINDHFDNLIMQLKEVEDVFIPIKKEIDCQFAIPLIEQPKKQNVRQVLHPHLKGFFKSFHFQAKKPVMQFTELEENMPSSALELQAISGIPIVLSEVQTRTSFLPPQLPEYERNYKLAFKPSSSFDPKYLKVSKIKPTLKKEKTLADIFGKPTVDKSGFTLEQILNNDADKKK